MTFPRYITVPLFRSLSSPLPIPNAFLSPPGPFYRSPWYRRVEMGLPTASGTDSSQGGEGSYMLPVSRRLVSAPCSGTNPRAL